MKGSRPLTDTEVVLVKSLFSGRDAIRNRTLFTLGINTGFRVSEILSLKVGDVVERNGSIVDFIVVQKRKMKGGKASRTVYTNHAVKVAVKELLAHIKTRGTDQPHHYLFKSTRGENAPISRVQVWRVLDEVFAAAELPGKLGTHVMRKTFAYRINRDFCMRQAAGEAIEPLRATSKALGHADVATTEKYLSFLDRDLDETIERVGI